MRVIALNYHDVVRPDQVSQSPRSASIYTLKRCDFVEHLMAIRGSAGAVRVESVEDPQYPGGEVPIFLTFDDGAECAYSPIADDLDEYGWRGHFFVTTDWIGRQGFLDRRRIRRLSERGHVIGSHSCSHPDRMAELGRQRLEREWSDSCAILSDITGRPVLAASVAGGFYSHAVARTALECGIKYLFTSEPRQMTWQVDDCLVLGRYVIRRFTRASVVGALCAGAKWPLVQQSAFWFLSNIVKEHTGNIYERGRRFALARLLRTANTRRTAGRAPL